MYSRHACGNYDDDDFIAAQMCCGCGGGHQVQGGHSSTEGIFGCTDNGEYSPYEARTGAPIRPGRDPHDNLYYFQSTGWIINQAFIIIAILFNFTAATAPFPGCPAAPTIAPIAAGFCSLFYAAVTVNGAAMYHEDLNGCIDRENRPLLVDTARRSS